MTISWGSLTADDKLYLLPEAPVAGGKGGLVLGSSSLRFLSARIIVRRGRERVIDTRLTWEGARALKSELPENHVKRLNDLLEALSAPRAPLELIGDRVLAFTKPRIMGVLNVTPDSFSDGGKFTDPEAAITHARAMKAAGADIVDIGGESTRPGAEPVWEGEEAERVLPVIEAIGGEAIVSIDSRHSTVMEKAIASGAAIINDVSALTYDPEAEAVALAADCPVVLMHAKGEPKSMQENPDYDDVLLEVFDYMEERRDAAIVIGIKPENIILDPGIGFGKRVVKDNLALLNGISMFHTLGCPILLGASRKRFIGAITGVEEAESRVEGSIAAALSAVAQGVQIVRVHDVAETKQALEVFQACQDAAAMELFQR